MRIEGLVADPRRAGSVRVMVGGHVAWTVPRSVIAELNAAEGHLLTSEMLLRLERGADEEAAFRAGLRSLERRAHASRELGNKLQRKGHPELAVEAALARLTALGLLDDVKFSADYIRTRAERGRGPRRLLHDLMSLGIARDLIDSGLAALPKEDEDGLAVPRAMAAKRAQRMVGLPRETRRRRLAAFLSRRGYQGEERKRIVDEVLRAGN